MICESMAAQFFTFVPNGELQGKGTDRLGILQPALATSSPFSAAQQKCFRLLSIQFKISTLCFKTTTQSAIVRRCLSFGFLPLFEAGSSVGGFDSFNWLQSLWKRTRPTFCGKTEMLVLSKSPLNRINETSRLRWQHTEQISRENKASRVSNLRCGWSCQAISVTSVTLYGPSLERIRCMKSLQSLSRLTRHAYGASSLPKTSENDCFAV